mmetsp:Transcript_32753/g.86083  ORF Transcript_32753/g.86083 Transcript_32753/m.86083 type:complete len:229 (+) Transcript_32753:152-838(+)
MPGVDVSRQKRWSAAPTSVRLWMAQHHTQHSYTGAAKPRDGDATDTVANTIEPTSLPSAKLRTDLKRSEGHIRKLFRLPRRVLQQAVEELLTTEGRGQRKVALGRLLEVIDKLIVLCLRQPAQKRAILVRPAYPSEHLLQVHAHLFRHEARPLHGVAKLAAAVRLPQTLNSRHVLNRELRCLGEIDEATSDRLLAGKRNERVARQLVRLTELASLQRGEHRDVVEVAS